MKDLPTGLREELGRVLALLQEDTRIPAPRVVVVRGALRATLREGVFAVPSGYLDHWNRFGVVPTALVRDAAYEFKRASLSRAGVGAASIEADAMAYAEHVLRSVTD